MGSASSLSRDCRRPRPISAGRSIRIVRVGYKLSVAHREIRATSDGLSTRPAPW